VLKGNTKEVRENEKKREYSGGEDISDAVVIYNSNKYRI